MKKTFVPIWVTPDIKDQLKKLKESDFEPMYSVLTRLLDEHKRLGVLFEKRK